MNIQDKMQEIHQKYGVTEMANYKIQLFVDDLIKTEKEQLRLHSVSQQRELLIAYEKNHYTPQEWALASKQCIEDIDKFLAINCG
jgi:hypothetical protein